MDKQFYLVPKTHEERNRLRRLIKNFVDVHSLVPPLSLEELSYLSDNIIREHLLDEAWKAWLMVEIHNSTWQDVVAAIPYEKRILLLPKCLSSSTHCRADVDELGLLCQRCSRCSIPILQDEADSIGVMSIVAEGFTSVIPLIENRIVDCVIGVGCLDSLERAFPLLINNAVPGIAIPLNTAGCKDTNVDTEYVNAMLRMQSTSSDIYLLDYDYLKTTSEEWFSKSHLSTLLTDSDDQTSAIAREWLGGEGKRWRPYLLAATYLALSEDKDIPEAVQLAAIAVECFHKASLVHDDIQDNDMMRYGKKTVHAEHGVPMAINVGDMLLGEGYRLLTATGNMDLIRVAAEAHIALCKGQGMELEWSISPKRLTTSFVLDIIRHKTVPAFDVALLMGVICSGNNQVLQETLHRYSCALGMAYQLQDDVEDFETDSPLALRPSAVLATLCEQATDEEFVTSLLGDHDVKSFLRLPDNEPKLQDALARVKQLADKYHKEALDALHELRNVELKRLLFRVTKRILK